METKKTEALGPELTDDELKDYQARANELSKTHNEGREVHPVVQIDKDRNFARFVCFLKEPNYTTKLRLMDKAATSGVYSAGDELRELCTIKEASDAITYSDAPESDRFKLGVVDFAIGMVNRLTNQFKKK